MQGSASPCDIEPSRAANRADRADRDIRSNSARGFGIRRWSREYRGIGLPALILATATVVYTAALGHASLSSSEAYSALAAAQGSLVGVLENAWRFDPGKPGAYQLLLHAVRNCFGDSEIVLRAPSVIFALAAIVIVYLIGCDLFGPPSGSAAAALWAFNPLTIVLARWARPYSMFLALALAQFLSFLRLRERYSPARLAVSAGLTAAMLYTHLGGLLWVGAELAILARDWYRDRPDRTWWALFLGLLAFAPYLPPAMHQGHELLFGHFLDYFGKPQAHSWFVTAATVCIAGAIGIWLIVGPQLEAKASEPVRTCLSCAAVPIMGLVAGSVLFHPIFNVRYVAPCFGLAAALTAGGLGAAGPRVRNLAVTAVAAVFLAMSPSFLMIDPEPWREIAHAVSDRARPSEPMLFEVNIVDNMSGRANGDFPSGFLRVPFDRYFAGTNPRRILPDFDPQAARIVAARAAESGSGAWLISGRKPDEVRTELPQAGFAVSSVFHRGVITVYHLEPLGRRQAVDRIGTGDRRQSSLESSSAASARVIGRLRDI